MNISWDDLSLALHVAEEGSLSAAAQAMQVSQPTVGRRLDALESVLGDRLFVRSPRGLKPTSLGDFVIERARRMRDESMAIARGAVERDQALQGEIKISTVTGLAANWLTPHLADFMSLYPDITVTVIADNHEADLVNREADLALRLYRPTQNSLICRKLTTLSYGLYASGDYLVRYGRPKSVDDLSHHRWVGWIDDDINHEFDACFGGSEVIEGQRILRSNEYEVHKQAVRRGLALGLLVNADVQQVPELVRLFPDIDIEAKEVWLVAHADVALNRRMRAMFDFIVDRAASDVALKRGIAASDSA